MMIFFGTPVLRYISDFRKKEGLLGFIYVTVSVGVDAIQKEFPLRALLISKPISPEYVFKFTLYFCINFIYRLMCGFYCL